MRSASGAARAAAAAGAAVLWVAGCGLVPGGGGDERGAPEEDEREEQESAAAEEGPWAIEVPLSSKAQARFDVEPVERREDRTVLRFTFTYDNEERDTYLPWGDLSAGGTPTYTSVRGLRLVDPVGQRYYYPLTDPDNSSRGSLGTELPRQVRTGAHYEMEVHYPPLPESAEHVTLLLPLDSGPLTGLPVVEGAAPEQVPEGDPPGTSSLEPGDRVALPVKDGPMGDPEEDAYDLYAISEGTVERDSSASEEQIALRADVLFAFDEDTLEDEAGDILDDIVRETAERADPDQPPITIVGHTDGVGEDEYNQDLSERRAQTVREYLEDGLGSEYAYETEGRGSEEPLAEEGGDDDEEARERNRRVEISYNVLQEADTVAEADEDTEAVEEHGAGHVGAPGALDWDSETPQEREVVGTLSGDTGGSLDYELDVHPFRRDGAYLIAEFTLTHSGGTYHRSARDFQSTDLGGAEFGAFGAVDPDTGQILRAVRIGQRDDDGLALNFVSSPGFPYHVYEEFPDNRGYFYVPAPPPDVEALDFDAGPLGALEAVPVR